MANADLRPMTIGEVLDRTFRLYKSDFWLFAGIMSLPFFVLFIFNVSLAWVSRAHIATVGTAHSPGAIIGAALGGALLFFILIFTLTGIGQAATIFAVSDLYLGRTASIRGSFRQVWGHVLQVLGVIFLVFLLIMVGFIFLIIPGIILMCRAGVAVPAAMLEDDGPITAISRSMHLTKGFAMQMFLIFVLTWVLATIATVIFQLPFTIMAMTPHPHVLPLGMAILQDVTTFISQVLIAPVGGIAFSLMYYNLRVRKEAFDLEHLMGAMGTGPSAGGIAPGAVLPA
ncbi:MAG TPA: hypothetical protein VGU63_07465 [Candidatus Acidoferrales bacterium]|nr:hypothetical protein [Candidatus Acidoferrales bacterium]